MSCKNQGGQYFAFLIVGMTSYACISTSVGALHAALSTEIRSGGLEALLSTPTSLPVLVVGMMGQAFSVTGIHVIVVLLASSMLGARFVPSSALIALTILGVLVAAYVGLGVLAAAMVLAFKTPGPLPAMILMLSAFFGGVYYPTQVIPSWLTYGSYAVPLTYGLRALRQTLLEGASLSAIAPDLAILAVFSIVLLAVGSAVFLAAVRYARATGTLAQY